MLMKNISHNEQIFKNCLVYIIVRQYSAKLKFFNPNDESRAIDLLKAERDVFNFCSIKHFETSNDKEPYGPKLNNITDLHKKCYFPFRKLHPEIPSQVVIRGERACLGAYRSVKSNKHKITKPVQKKRLSIQLDKRLYSIKGNIIKLTPVGGKRIRCYFDQYLKLQELLQKFPIGDLQLYVKDCQIWIGFPFKEPETPISNEKLAIGVDLGKRRLACTSEGIIISGKQFNKALRKIRFQKRTLWSKGTKSAKRKLKKLKHKEQNTTKQFVHQTSNEILKTKANVIVLEDLSKIKTKIKKNKHHKINSLSQVPFRILRDMLSYKARSLGKEVDTVSSHMTSKEDYRKIKPGKRKGCRYYTCDDKVFDSDVQAAINIAIKSKHPVSFVEPIDGSFKPFGQAVANRPNVYKPLFCKVLQIGFNNRLLAVSLKILDPNPFIENLPCISVKIHN